VANGTGDGALARHSVVHERIDDDQVKRHRLDIMEREACTTFMDLVSDHTVRQSKPACRGLSRDNQQGYRRRTFELADEGAIVSLALARVLHLAHRVADLVSYLPCRRKTTGRSTGGVR
jgi:hypothetical protein